MLSLNITGGISCCVMPQNWLFLNSYMQFREKLLKNETWSIVARLGPKSFQTPMWDFNVMLLSIQHIIPSEFNVISGLDVSHYINAMAKDDALRTVEIKTANQKSQLENPDGRVAIGESVKGELLGKYAKALQGIATGDFSHYGRWFWEIQKVDNKNWIFQQTTFSETENYVGKHNIIFWEEGKGTLCASPGARVQGLGSKHRFGIAVTQMATINATINTKTFFDNNCSVILPNKSEYLLPIWTYITTGSYNLDIRKIDQKVSVTNATLVKVPFDLEHWQKIAKEKYPNGLPKPYSDDPTQWLFHGHPIKTENPLQVALARLLGYRWPAEVEKVEAASSGLNNNADGSSVYDSLADEAKELIEAVKAFDHLSDEDGIFCIPSVNAEQAGAERLRDYLQEVFKEEWNNQTIPQLLQKEGAKSTNVEAWLRDEFFVQHCKVFQNRPFIWHIWDGRKDGFSALVNYHKLTKDNLSKLIYTYLGDWIRMCEAKRKTEESGAEGLLSAALKLKEKLEAILEGEAPHDIFIRWKSIDQQPIGWEPDLNDGVRLNIRPFVEAGVLRSKFNVKWGVDRGKNPTITDREKFPTPYFSEIRDNDKHIPLEEKRASREKKNI